MCSQRLVGGRARSASPALRFANAGVQGKVDELSRRGQGKPSDETIVKVPSDMRGGVRLRRQQLSLPAVVFAAPGRDHRRVGRLRPRRASSCAFRGVAKLDAAMSRTQTGARRFLLRPIDPLFRKRGAGTRLVVDVRGTRATPVVDLDVGRRCAGGGERAGARHGGGDAAGSGKKWGG